MTYLLVTKEFIRGIRCFCEHYGVVAILIIAHGAEVLYLRIWRHHLVQSAHIIIVLPHNSLVKWKVIIQLLVLNTPRNVNGMMVGTKRHVLHNRMTSSLHQWITFTSGRLSFMQERQLMLNKVIWLALLGINLQNTNSLSLHTWQLHSC